LIEFPDTAAVAAARERGEIVHRAIHAENDHDLDREAFARDFPEWWGYVQGWITFCQQREFVPVLNEYRLASDRLDLAGTIDCLGVLDGGGVLLDFATGRPEDVAKDLQTAGYLMLARECASDDPALAAFLDAHKVIRRFAVSLRRDASFRIEAYDDPGDTRAFLALMEAERIIATRRRRRGWPEVAA
jgi:hypothetical protein